MNMFDIHVLSALSVLAPIQVNTFCQCACEAVIEAQLYTLCSRF